MREEFALSVLRVSFMGVPILALEIWNAPCFDICGVGGAGMGMECLSKYGCELDGRGWVTGDPDPWGIV